MALHIDNLRDLDGWGEAARGQVESRLAPPAEQLRAVETLLRAGMAAPAVARAVHWPVEAVRREAARLKLDASSGIAPVAAPVEALVEPEPPQRPLAAPTAHPAPAIDAEAVRPAENALQATVERAVTSTSAPALPAWLAEARAAAPEPPSPRRQAQHVRPTLVRALLDWLAPAEGEEHAPLPWRRLLPWAGGIAAAVLLLAALLPHGPSSVAASSAPVHYRCALPSGAVVLTMNVADCSSVIEGIAQKTAQQAVPTVATIPPAAQPTQVTAKAPQQPQTAQPSQKAPVTAQPAAQPQQKAPAATKQPTTAPKLAATAPAASVTATTAPQQTVSFGPATTCYETWWGTEHCTQAAFDGKMSSGIPSSVQQAVCKEEGRPANCGA